MQGIYEKEFELGINEVDRNNQMKLSTCLKLMQEIGAMHSKAYGYCLDTESKTHKAWVVLAWNLEIFSKPSWNSKIYARTWIDKIDKIYFYRNFEMYSEKGELVAKASSQWIMIDTVKGKIQKVTDELLSQFIEVNTEEKFKSIKKLNPKFDVDSLEEIYRCKVQKRDVDTNNHMNNIVYLDLAQEGLEDSIVNAASNIEVYYKSECKLGEEIVFMKNEKNDVYILDKDKTKLHTLIKFKKGENEND